MLLALSKKRKTLLTLVLIALVSCSKQNLSVQSQIPPSTLENNPDVTMMPTFALEHPNASPTATPIALPALEPDEAENALRQLLMEQPHCESPCFWGVIPNQTTLGEAQNVFNRLGLNLKQTLQEGQDVFYAADLSFENGISISIVLRVQDNLINSARTNIGFVGYTGSFPLQETLAFSPQSVQSKYGVPTYVEFHIAQAPYDGSSPYTLFYAMIIYFNTSDLIIEYDSKLIKDENIIKICPMTDNLDGISLWQGKDAEDAPSKDGIPLEMATSLSLDQFADLMAGAPEHACFDLNREKFP